MKGIYGALVGVVGLAVTGRGTATAFLSRHQTPYGYTAGGALGENIEYGIPESSENANSSQSGGFSPSSFQQGSALRRRNAQSAWSAVAGNLQGSLVQLQADDKSASESKEEGEGNASAAESDAEKKSSASSGETKDSEGTDKSKPEEKGEASGEDKASNVEHDSAQDSQEQSEKGSGEHATNESNNTKQEPKSSIEHAANESNSAKEEPKSGIEHAANESNNAKQEPKSSTEHAANESNNAKQEPKSSTEHAANESNNAKQEPKNDTEHDEAHKNGTKKEKSATPEPSEFNTLISRLESLLKASKGKELFSRILMMIDLHEKEQQAEKELKKEAAKTEKAEEAPKKSPVTPIPLEKDLLLTQQLANMWVLPLQEDAKRDICLSGLEKLTHKATVTCATPECFKLETQAKQCPYMSIVSILRKDDLEILKGPSSKDKVKQRQSDTQKDHMLLGFDGQCKNPEGLGNEILSILQRPKNLAQKNAMERTTGSSDAVHLQPHHLDLICDSDDKAEYPACKTVYEALEHFAKPAPRALPEMLVLTDIADLKNTLGLYRITFLFEGLVPFATADGTKIDASQHRLSSEEAEFMHKQRHVDISKTVLLKGNN